MSKPVTLVAIVGGSGSGKSRLADQLACRLGKASAQRLSLDDYYRDRSHLSTGRRILINYDHPRAIDWKEFGRTLEALRRGRPMNAPIYSFSTHCRKPERRTVEPRRIVIVDGLWLLVKRPVRELFDLTVFIKCPARLRLSRRLARDAAVRGRTRESIIEQFRTTVEPMHRQHVEPQADLAHILVQGTYTERDVDRLITEIAAL